jgi:hypothetical protein
MSCLWAEGKPDSIPAFWDVPLWRYHVSLPTGRPVVISPCKLSSVICVKSCLRVNLGLTATGASTSLPLAKNNSTEDSFCNPTSSAKDFGIRTAKLLPHFRTRVFIVVLHLPQHSSVYTLNILRRESVVNARACAQAVHHSIRKLSSCRRTPSFCGRYRSTVYTVLAPPSSPESFEVTAEASADDADYARIPQGGRSKQQTGGPQPRGERGTQPAIPAAVNKTPAPPLCPQSSGIPDTLLPVSRLSSEDSINTGCR